MQANLPRNAERSVRVRNLLFRRRGDDQIARLRADCFRQFLQPLRAEIFLERRGDSFRRDFHRVHAARARRFREFGKLVELLARPRRRARRDHGLHVAFDVQRLARGLEELRSHSCSSMPKRRSGLSEP